MNGATIAGPGTRLACVILIAFVAIAYWPSLSVPFAFDDLPNIVFNQRVQPEGWSELVLALDARGSQDRPVAMVSFALNYLFGGLDTTGYHVVNLAIHAINALLLFALLRLLARAPRSPLRLASNATTFAFASALLWALHPVNTQAVTYIVQRMASLAALFYLLALLLFVLWRLGALRARWVLPGIVLAFAAGMGTKPHVVTLPAALVLLDIAFFTGWRRYHAVAAVVLAACAIPLAALFAGGLFQHFLEAPAHRDFSGLERWLTQGRVIWHYLSLLAWPDAGRLQLDYDFAISRSLLDPPITILAWSGLLALTGAALYGLRRWPWPAAGWLFFMLTLSVESSFILLEMAFEHRLYLPSLLLIPGLIAPVFAWLEGENALRRASMIVLLLAGLCGWQTIERNRDWRDPATLWAGELERGASPQRAALNSAFSHLRSGQSEQAVSVLSREGLDASGPDRARIYQMRGEALFAQGRCERALEEFKRALELAPGWARAAHFSARCLLMLDRDEAARDMLGQMRRLQPDHVFTITLEADVTAREGDLDGALQMLQKYLEQSGGLSAVSRSFIHMQRGNLYRHAEQHGKAAEAFRQATELHPNNWAAWSSLYHVLLEGGNTDRAEDVRGYLYSRGVDPDRWR